MLSLVNHYLAEEQKLNSATVDNATNGGDERKQGRTRKDFAGQNLSNADLKDCDLQGADLRGTNLSGAILKRAILKEADLSEANLTEADLRDADLTETVGLTTEQLMRANLAGARLPDAIASFDGLNHVEASAGIARPLFVLNLLLCAYALAVVGSTTDAALLTNAPSSLLPDIDTPLPTKWFYFSLPAVILAIYIYFHAHLEQIVQDIMRLPAVFPDGISITRKIYPWFLLRLVAREVSGQEKVLTAGFSTIRAMVNLFMIGVAWWLTPMTLLIIWLTFLPSHDWLGTLWIIALTIISCGAGGFGIRSVRLRGEHPGFFGPDLQKWRSRAKIDNIVRGALALIAGATMLAITAAIYESNRLRSISWLSWAPGTAATFVEAAGFHAFADFEDQQVSRLQPDGTIVGAELRDRDLTRLKANRAFLALADLSRSNLSDAELEEANLKGALLSQANMRRVKARGAFFDDANLRGALLAEADLTEADLVRTTLAEAKLPRIDLQAADLTCAKANEVDLRHSDLRSVIAVATNFRKSLFHGAIIKNGDFSHTSFHNATLLNARIDTVIFDVATFEGTDLTGAQIKSSSFQHVDFFGADFTGATFASETDPPSFRPDFSGADLEFTNILQAQLDHACGDDNTDLPEGMTIGACTNRRPIFTAPDCKSIVP